MLRSPSIEYDFFRLKDESSPKKLSDRRDIQGVISKTFHHGGQNSKIFYGIINKKRLNKGLSGRGVLTRVFGVTDPSLESRSLLYHDGLSGVGGEEARRAQRGTRGVSRDEIRSAVWDCGENKSPGPDGFTFEFFRRYWEFIGPDFCDAVEHFFVNGSFSKGCTTPLLLSFQKYPDAKFG
ncbi:hypothetical protein Tco_0080156 [Tanacetum coccineum]